VTQITHNRKADIRATQYLALLSCEGYSKKEK